MRADDIQMNGPIKPAVITLTDAATIATDASKGNHFRVTLGGNRTLGNPSNPTDGQRMIWEFLQDGTGNRTITLDTKFSVPGNMAAVTLTTVANHWDMIGVIYNSSLDKFIVTGFMNDYV